MIHRTNNSINASDETQVSVNTVQSKTDKLIFILLPLMVVTSALIFKFAFNFHMDSDPLWSIGVGEWININRAVPHVDVFSWTVAGEQWSSNSWLFCWLMYLADQSMGYLGIALIIFIPTLAAGYFLYLMCKKYHDSSFSILLFTVSINLLVILSIAPRAYIYTFPFIAAIMYLLRFKRDSKWIYTIPLIMLLWVNVQTSIRFGMAILFVEALVGTIFYKDRKLWPVVILAFLATLINPYGLGVWDISFADFLTPGTPLIAEWRAPDFNSLGVLMLYGVLFIVALVGAYRLKDDLDNRVYDRDKIMILFWFWAALLYAMTTARAIAYVMLLLAPFFASFTTETSREPRFLRPVYLILVLVLFFTSLTTGYALFPLETDPQSGKPLRFVEYLQANPTLSDTVSNIIPFEAVEFLYENPSMTDRLFNSYLCGGYLLYKNIEVFIDARADVFIRHGVIQDYANLAWLQEKPETIIDKYKIRTFLLSSNENLVYYLDLHPEWQMQYEDNTAIIYTKLR